MANFGPKHVLTPLIKTQFIVFLNLYHKKHWPGLYFLKKENKKKMANFRPKPWTNPFEKILIFRHCELVIFII